MERTSDKSPESQESATGLYTGQKWIIENPKFLSVVISGESYNGLVDKDNNSISDDPEYILAHEIAGHADPRLNDKGDGKTVNAVEVENIIRKETNAKERREEPNHVQ